MTRGSSKLCIGAVKKIILQTALVVRFLLVDFFALIVESRVAVLRAEISHALHRQVYYLLFQRPSPVAASRSNEAGPRHKSDKKPADKAQSAI